MAEPFVETETCRTKCRWVARVFREFNRPRTTVRSLFYHALRRGEPDYPICGGFVGEIRVTRQFDESDASRLVKWATLASELGYIPHDAILEEVPGINVLIPDRMPTGAGVELWIDRSAFNSLIWPVCKRYEITLVSVSGARLDDALRDLRNRAIGKDMLLLCMADLSPAGLSFVRALEDAVSGLGMRMTHIALTPEQVARLQIPMVRADKRATDRGYRELLKSAGLDGRMMAELDALEACYPGGIACFLESLIREHAMVART
ncbi:MAG: hypothetical protein NQU42_05380 [Methanothrix sp.]|uniref:hypothetical protein n=1 Tax=Methanothrix sp. TaxID=90426 RepID=UPI0025EBAEE6|nr:hypothetical protein [Methanothrix sp.]MCQ8903505.1 hypothetical protein [Methanothrix sp.]